MLCWICKENMADSGEHKFKSSQLKRMYGKQFSEEIAYGNNSKELRLEGPNNKKVKFPKVICQDCNNTRTSPHDNAFDKLINWSQGNYENLKAARLIDFEQVYKYNWIEQKRNLLKYMAKHAGCKVITSEQENDISNLSNLIARDANTNSFQIKFIVKEGFNHLDILIKRNNGSGLKFMSNSETVVRETKDHEIVYFAGMTTYNWLSIVWVYSQNNYLTMHDGFTNQKEDLTFLPFDELPEISEDENWFNLIDKQGMETLENQIKYYDSLIKTTNNSKQQGI